MAHQRKESRAALRHGSIEETEEDFKVNWPTEIVEHLGRPYSGHPDLGLAWLRLSRAPETPSNYGGNNKCGSLDKHEWGIWSPVVDAHVPHIRAFSRECQVAGCDFYEVRNVPAPVSPTEEDASRDGILQLPSPSRAAPNWWANRGQPIPPSEKPTI